MDYNENANEKIIDAFLTVAPYINPLTVTDFAIAICDNEKYIYYLKGDKIDHGIKAGDKLKSDGILSIALREKRRIIKRIEDEVFGFPYIGAAMPIIGENGTKVGAVALLESVEMQDSLFNISDKIYSGMGKISEESKKIFDIAKQLRDVCNGLELTATESSEKIKETDEILNFIKSVSKKSKLLGLNAAIEAARAGEEGKGFGVVSSEIRKLAENSSASTERIEKVLKEIQEDGDAISLIVSEMEKVGNEQVASTDAVLKSLEDINKNIKDLKERAKKLSMEVNH